MRCGFHAGRVDWTCDLSHGSKSKSHGSNMPGYVPWPVGWFPVPHTFPRMSFSLVLLPALFDVVCARKNIKIPQPTHGQLAPPVTLDHRIHPRRATRRATWLSMQSPAPAISLAGPPPAASPQLGRWICHQGLRSARMRYRLLCACCCQRCCCAAAVASTTPALGFTFGYILYWYVNSRAT